MNEQELLALEDKRFAAMIARDFAALDKLVHDELLYTHSSGVTDTKASWLEAMKSGKIKYKSASCSERQVRFFGEIALDPRARGDPGRNRRPAQVAAADVPQRVDKHAAGLEVRRLAVHVRCRRERSMSAISRVAAKTPGC